jgi:hypothetical protein
MGDAKRMIGKGSIKSIEGLRDEEVFDDFL